MIAYIERKGMLTFPQETLYLLTSPYTYSFQGHLSAVCSDPFLTLKLQESEIQYIYKGEQLNYQLM
jgi:hypothetical protein